MYAYEAIVIINYYQDKNLENGKRDVVWNEKELLFDLNLKL